MEIYGHSLWPYVDIWWQDVSVTPNAGYMFTDLDRQLCQIYNMQVWYPQFYYFIKLIFINFLNTNYFNNAIVIITQPYFLFITQMAKSDFSLFTGLRSSWHEYEATIIIVLVLITKCGNFLLEAPQTLPSESVQKSKVTVRLLYTFGGGPPPFKIVQKSQYQYQCTRVTLADEALYYITIYPNSCDLGTAHASLAFGQLRT